MSELAEKKCVPCEGGVPAIPAEKARELSKELDGWEFNEQDNYLFKDFSFKNFYKTMSFVNAIAWIANQENHHPDMSVGYNYCRVELKTHAISGLSENDFILASKIDRLMR